MYLKRYGPWAGYLFIIIIWVIWCFIFLPKGLDFTDEGYYCSQAWRFSQGDLPFKDGWAPAGLSFWWLSWVFTFVPNCSLLGLRAIWAVILLLGALISARIMFKYYNPIISAVGVIIGLFFATYWSLKILTYNNIYIPELILAIWLWLIAGSGNTRYHLFMACAAGLMAALATTCRLSLLPVILLPFVTTLYDWVCGIDIKTFKLPVAYFAGYLAGLLLFFLLLSIWGVLGDLTRLASNEDGYHSVSDIFINYSISCFYYLIPTLLVLPLVAIVKYKDIKLFAKSYPIRIYVVVAAILVFLLIMAINRSELTTALDIFKVDFMGLISGPFNVRTLTLIGGTYPIAVLPLFSIAMCIVAVDLILHVFEKDYKAKFITHERSSLGIIIIFILFVIMAGTANLPAKTPLEIAFMPVGMATGIIWLWVSKYPGFYGARDTYTIISSSCLAIILIFCALVGVINSRYPYGDSCVDVLTTIPNAPKLACIYTTPDRARITDEVVEAVEKLSKDGSRILAYDEIPMIYYLSSRLPSEKVTWVRSDMSFSVRSLIVDDMIKRNRLPSLVVRTSGYQPRIENDPIDAYVLRHYKLVQEIDGFQILLPVDYNDKKL